jgi:hypothetical protein
MNIRNFLFRSLLLYFLLQTVPLDPRYYSTLFSLPWHRLRYQDFFTLAHYTPRFFGTQPSFADWAVVLTLSLIGAAVWKFDTTRWYYWVRTFARYRLAIGLLAFGFIKLLPLQVPYPSLSNLNTPYGDFTRWKLFSLSLGVVPSYESFLGGVEIAAALLLLYRKTASIGALIVVFFTGNVLMSNLAYEGGEYVYSAYLISLALFILAYDAGRLTDLIVFHRAAAPNTFRLSLPHTWQRYGRLAVKTLVVFFFVVLLGLRTREGYLRDPYQLPETPGLARAIGLYNVTLFRLNKDTLPYSPTDSLRWKNVVFEPWATLSIAGNSAADIDSGNTEQVEAATAAARTYESEGSNGRRYYDYDIDTTAHALVLRNKNGKDTADSWKLRYDRPGDTRIILSGTGPRNDSVYVVLDRIDKKYLLEEAAKTGRTKNLKL